MNNIYKAIIDNQETIYRKTNNKNKYYSLLRLFTFIIGVVITYILFQLSVTTGVCALVLFIGLFVVLVNYQNKNNLILKKSDELIKIYKNEINDINKKNIFGDGNEYTDTNHSYSSDLDLFGKHSLFSYINRTVSKDGSKILANWLKEKSSINEIKIRQSAIKELSAKHLFKEEFLRNFFLSTKSVANDSNRVTNWINNFKVSFIKKNGLKIFIKISPLIILLSFVFSYYFPILWIVFTFFIFLNLIVLIKQKNNVDKIHQYVSKHSNIFYKYSKLISLIKNESFKNTILVEIKNDLVKHYKPDYQLIKISKLSNKLDYRLDMFISFFLNTFLLWDIHISIEIEKWFLNNRKDVLCWLESIGKMDALLSLSILYFNHPNWCFPAICSDYFVLNAKDIGHPLIPANKRITNDYNISGIGKIDIITGSNMAGKSTFLRTIGVNMILAFTGAPVCAKSMSVSLVDINTNMRTQDSLEENTSSFYAELKRIKKILLEIKNNNNCFLLLDELLKGTNSNDKYIGSVAIIKQLLKHNTVGLISTHDLKLTKLHNKYPYNINNYNFDVTVNNKKMEFNYKLKNGICKSFNASLLMKEIGIDLNIESPLKN